MNAKFEKWYIESRIDISDSGCWEWTRCRNSKGYGNGAIAGHSSHLAHRLSYEVFVGPIPFGMSVCHKCDNPPCVNPDHLFVGTHRDNFLDASRKGRLNGQWKTHCLRGHEFTELNTVVKDGLRRCRECARDNTKKRMRKMRSKRSSAVFNAIKEPAK